jgi:translation elongation factor P/translation initiation factor 5A
MPSKSNNPEILQLLHQDHEEVQGLFEQFQKSVSAKNGEKKADAISKQIFEDLKLHTELEEKIVYPNLKEQDAKIFYEAGEEHHVVDLLIAELQQLKVSAPEYTAKMTVMEENVKHHIQEEESQMFKLISQLPDDTLSELAEAWKSQKQRAQK